MMGDCQIAVDLRRVAVDGSGGVRESVERVRWNADVDDLHTAAVTRLHPGLDVRHHPNQYAIQNGLVCSLFHPPKRPSVWQLLTSRHLQKSASPKARLGHFALERCAPEVAVALCRD